MSMYALVSSGGAAGVTTTALALALTWPQPVIVAECDPAGGAILAGLFAGHLPAPRGLLGVASAIARVLASQPCDVIADCGRLDAGDGQPASVLAGAALVAMVIRPTLRYISAARPRIEMLLELRGGPERLGLLLVGERGHSPAEIARTLGIPVLASLPFDARTASVLSDGVGRRASLADRPLMRAARSAGPAVARAGAGSGQPGLAAAATGGSA